MTDVVNIARANGIFILTFDRAASRNALSVEMAEAIVATLAEADGDATVRGIVLTGAGDRAFCAGVDLAEAQAVTPDRVEGWFATVCAVYRQIVMTDKPVIAGLNGVAAGAGFQIALAADLRVAHGGVRIGQPEINAGIPSIMGGHWMGLHLGRSVVQDLSLTGRLIEAAEGRTAGADQPDGGGGRGCGGGLRAGGGIGRQAGCGLGPDQGPIPGAGAGRL
jgi:enoyl-CoA hydratase/carnithine racemase